jgi:hypothetical protein
MASAATPPEREWGRPDLVGTWKLIGASAISDGEVDEAPYGSAPAGFITYTEDGRMSAVITHGERKPLSIADRIAAPIEERAGAFATLIAYAGGYRIAGNTVIHNVEAASVQNWVGTELVRLVSFQDGCLILRTPPTSLGGHLRSFELRWERLK